MRIVCRCGVIAGLALALPSLVLAWPGAIQMGTPIRITSPALGDSAVVGSYVRHDDSTLTFRPDRPRRGERVRFADITRLDADTRPGAETNPSHPGHHDRFLFGALGAVVGYGLGWSTAQEGADGWISRDGMRPIMGALFAIPGLILGEIIANGPGGGKTVAPPGHVWLELPRDDWANGFALQASAVTDSTTR